MWNNYSYSSDNKSKPSTTVRIFAFAVKCPLNHSKRHQTSYFQIADVKFHRSTLPNAGYWKEELAAALGNGCRFKRLFWRYQAPCQFSAKSLKLIIQHSCRDIIEADSIFVNTCHIKKENEALKLVYLQVLIILFSFVFVFSYY